MKARALAAALARLGAIAALASLTAGGCGGDDPVTCTRLVPAGTIQGHVRSGGIPFAADVLAYKVGDASGNQDEAIVQAKVYPGGVYSMDLPAGRYVVQVRLQSSLALYWYSYTAAGPQPNQVPPDTLIIDPGHTPITIDFDLAAVHLHFDLSPRSDEGVIDLVLHRRNDPETSRVSLLPGGPGRSITGAVDFTVPGILPGEYKAELVIGTPSSTRGGEHVWVPGTRDSTGSPWIEIPADRITEITGAADPAPARIEGDVVGAWQEIGSGPPAVGLVTPDSQLVIGPRAIDDHGHFAFDLYSDGPVKLFVEDHDLVRWMGGREFDEAQLLDLERGGTVADVRIVESGLLLDVVAPAHDLGSTLIRLYNASGGASAASVVARPRGMLIPLPNLSPGQYLLYIDSARWRPQWYDRAATPQEARPITIAHEGEVVRVPLVLEGSP